MDVSDLVNNRLIAPLLMPIADSSQVSDARRRAADLAKSIGFDEIDAGRVALVVTEAAINGFKHATDAALFIRVLDEDVPPGIEVIALDRGPGMPRFDRCVRDGYSTSGTPGSGLGAMTRVADTFDVHSVPAGTAVLMRLWPAGFRRVPQADAELGVVCLPVATEIECGDAWTKRRTSRGLQILVIDGLGHGPLAAATAHAATQIFRDSPDKAPGALLEAIHDGLQGTRGAAAGLAELDWTRRRLTFAGIGNIAAAVIDAEQIHSLVSHPGTLGCEAPRVQEFASPWLDEALLVMHSDGLRSQWHLDAYPGLCVHDPALIAAVLYRDFARGRDDVTVLVARAPTAARAGP